MGVQFLPSHTESLVISWLFFGFVTLGVVLCIFNTVAHAPRGRARFLSLWILVCVLALSPARYLFLLVIVAVSYPAQSPTAFVSSLILAVYMPLIFVVLATIGVGLPLVAVADIAGRPGTVPRYRTYLAAGAAPVLLLLCNGLFFSMLPVAARTTYWLEARNVIRATNGPAEYVYRYLVEPGSGLGMPAFVERLGAGRLDPTERLRAHFAATYLSPERFGYYRRGRSQHHLIASIRLLERAETLLEGPSAWCDPPAEQDQQISEWARQARWHAQRVDPSELNDWVAQLGDHYRDELGEGLERIIRGRAQNDAARCASGQRLLGQWQAWYGAHVEQVRVAR